MKIEGIPPENILRLMNPEDRRRYGNAGLTAGGHQKGR